MAPSVRVRFAPSPTGYLHVGGARTALFNYLFARHHGGSFILRIEDTDRARYQEDACKEIFESLRWLGMQWDEGPDTAGAYGPYYQSQRVDTYLQYAQTLMDTGHAYRCFCTEERLQQVRETQKRNHQAPGYDRHCRNLSAEEEKKLLDRETPYVVRLKIPLHETVTFTDMIRGEITYQSHVLDDLVLLKSDGYPTYHLANIIDDHFMQISHVFRGDEWIASTPRHIILYRAFGWEPPMFAHLPIIKDPEGGKLSKRRGAASVMDFKRKGILADALFNFLALLGWSPGDDREKMTRQEIIEAFTVDRISPKASVFDPQKLEWLNGQYLVEVPVDAILADLVAMWKERGFVSAATPQDDPYCRTVASLMKDRFKTLVAIADNAHYFFRDPEAYDEKTAKKRWKKDSPAILEDIIAQLEHVTTWDAETLEEVYREYAEHHAVSAGKLIHPTRLVVSGVGFGPSLFALMEALGKETVLRRMKTGLRSLGA
jgi:glutamyl-tRNA synthetase